MKLISLVVLALLGLSAGCGSGSTAPTPADAVFRVLKTQNELVTKRNEALVAAPTPPDAAVTIERYCSDLGKTDLSGCPKDFEDAFREHVRSCALIPEAVKQLPSTTPPQTVLDLLSGVTVEVEGATALKEAVQGAGDSWLLAKDIGLKYAPEAYMLDYPTQTGDPTLEFWNAFHRYLLLMRLPIKADTPDIQRKRFEGSLKTVIGSILSLTTDGVDPELVDWSQRVVVSFREEMTFGSPTVTSAELTGPSTLRGAAAEQWLKERKRLRVEGQALQIKLSEKHNKPFPPCGL